MPTCAAAPALRETTADDDGAQIAAAEQGFTLIEIIVALIIIAILMAVAVPTFLSSKDATRQKQAATLATSMSGAVEQFKLDHANVIPILNSQDWPDAKAGPVSRLSGTPMPYLKSIPEELASGVAVVSTAAAGGGSELVHVQYHATTDGYWFVASGRGTTTKPWNHTKDCLIGEGTGVPTTPHRC